ncbi:MAG: ATP-binding protein [Lachnospiraceae bacterium]|jgi:predicted ATPase|nr:ATP-binding protein [Lachnospiraceae bacterium]
MEHFITELRIGELLHLSDIRIELNPEKRTNLLLTGKNGSGKTTVLRALARHLCENGRAGGQTRRIQSYLAYLNKYGDGLKIIFNEEKEIHRLCKEGEFLTAFYRADRKTAISRQKGPEEVVLEKGYSVYFGPGDVLLKYLVHLKTQQAYARNEGDMETVQLLDQWFERFAGALRVLLDDETLQLKYDYKKYDFQIIEEGRKPFGFDQLSDGYSAAIQIVADLILRMEQNWLKEGILSSYDVEGVVLIDELETHLHISLQRKILPFLTEFFPRIQFIVATHSPYILNSIEDCVIFDLENHIRMENLSGYSAEGIVEGYFEQASYSEQLLQRLERYRTLVNTDRPTDEERAERARIQMEMKQIPGDLAREAKCAFEEIEHRRKQHDKV